MFLAPTNGASKSASDSYDMEIRFVSSLTPEDEEHLAQPLLHLVCALLDQLPIAYTLLIETTNGTTVQHIRESSEDEL
jgi:hypothetical protein